MKLIPFLFAAGLSVATTSAAWAQDAAKAAEQAKAKKEKAATDAEKDRREKVYAAEKQRSEAALKAYQQQAKPAAGAKTAPAPTPKHQ